MMKITRNDQLYRDIESFEEYELTQCSIYEMAIRSKWYDTELQKIIDLYSLHTEEKEDPIEVASNSTKIIDTGFNLGLDKYTEHPLLQTEIGIEACQIFTTLHKRRTLSNKQETFIHHIAEEHKVQIMQSIDLNGFTLHSTMQFEDHNLHPSIAQLEQQRFGNSPEGKQLYNEIATSITKKLLKEMYDAGDMHLFSTDIHIAPNFHRPQLSFRSIQERMASITLDFSLPKHELLEYISYIKDEFDEQEQISISPIALLDKEISEIFDVAQLQQAKGQKQITLATMFYVYDAFKGGMKQSEIKREVSYYNNANIDERTIKKYRNLMIDFIDEEKFKQITSSILL